MKYNKAPFILTTLLAGLFFLAAYPTPPTTAKKQYNSIDMQGTGLYNLGKLTTNNNNDVAVDEVLMGTVAGDIISAKIDDANIDAAADITRTKLAPGTVGHVLINDGSGEVSSEAQLAVSRGGHGTDFSVSTGVMKVTSGTFSANANINDLNDVNTSGVISGDAIVYNGSTWVPGSSGDSSFDLKTSTTTSLTVGKGTEILNGVTYCTCNSGACTTETHVNTDVVVVSPQLTLSGPANYYLYIDTYSAVSGTLTDSGRVCKLVYPSHFTSSTDSPGTGTMTDTTRYHHIGLYHVTAGNVIDAFYKENPKERNTWANLKLVEDKVVASAIANAQTNLTFSDWTQVTFGAEQYDLPSPGNFSSSVFTAPRNGKYHVSAVVNLVNISTCEAGELLIIGLDGTGAGGSGTARLGFPVTSTSGEMSLQTNQDIDMTAGQTVWVRVYQSCDNGGSFLTAGDGRNKFSVHEVTNYTTDAIATPNTSYRETVTAASAGSCGTGMHQISLPAGFTGRSDYSVETTWYDGSKRYTINGLVDNKNISSNTLCLNVAALSFTGGKSLETVVSLGAKATGIPKSTTCNVSTSYTVTDWDQCSNILFTTGSSDRTLTLPSASLNNARVIRFEKADSGSGKVSVGGPISGVSENLAIYKQYGFAEVISNGSSWGWVTPPTETYTWTPTMVNCSGGSYAAQYGLLTKVGNNVHLTGKIGYTGGSCTGNVVMGGIPFNAKNPGDAGQRSVGVVGGDWTGLISSANMAALRLRLNAPGEIQFVTDSGGASAYAVHGTNLAATFYFHFVVDYITDQ